MPQASAPLPSAGVVRGTPSKARARIDRFALALTKPTNIKRWYAGVLAFCAALVVMGLYVLINVLPEGSDIAGTIAFYAKYNPGLRVLSAFFALLFFVGTLWSGAFLGTLWEADPSRNRFYTWSALISELLVLGLFFVEAGLFAATVLLYGHAPDSTVHLLHVTAFVSAALLGPVWIPYALGALLISRQTGLFPNWLNKLLVIVIAIDICTITGVFTLSGPHNGENGLIGAFAGFLSPVVLVGGTVAWEFVVWAQYRASRLSAVNE